MNTINVIVNFQKGICYKDGIDLITGDYNSTKLVFDFDVKDGTKIFEMKNPKGEIVLIKEIIDDELILVGKDEEGNDYSLFVDDGEYKFEITLYKDSGKLTSVSNYLRARKEQIKSNDEIAKPYIPIFDNLMKDVTSKGDYAKEQGNYAKKEGDRAKDIGDELQRKIDSGEFNGGNTNNNYETLDNLPKINNITLLKNKTSKDLGLQQEMTPLTNMEIEKLLGGN